MPNQLNWISATQSPSPPSHPRIQAPGAFRAQNLSHPLMPLPQQKSRLSQSWTRLQWVTFCFIFYHLTGQEPCLGLLFSGSLLQAATQISRSEMSKRPLYAWAGPHFQLPSQSANSSALQPPTHQPLNWDISFPNTPQNFFWLTLSRVAPSPAEIWLGFSGIEPHWLSSGTIEDLEKKVQKCKNSHIHVQVL